jgi:hypothetical protein
MSTFDVAPPTPLGFWVLDTGSYEFRVAMRRRPSWLARWAMQVVFEIAWRDA